MKISRVFVDGFGKLSDKSFDLKDGLNCIKEDNGWGKSTLVTFIRVMFFGFANEGARGGNSERARFKPWAADRYGGYIEFGHNGKKYRVVRSFADNRNKDVFSLIDLSTDLESDDFSARLGEEIFGIDAEGFSRTLFVGQEDLVSSATDGVKAKLGDLSDLDDDMGRYDQVISLLNDAVNELDGKGRGARIKLCRNRINELDMEVRTMPSVEQAIDNADRLLQDSGKAQDEIEQEMKSLREEQGRSARIQADRAKKSIYDGLLDEKSRRQLRLNNCAAPFNGNIPTEEDIAYMRSLMRSLAEKEKQFAALQFSAEEKSDFEIYAEKFGDGEDAGAQADDLIAGWDQANNMVVPILAMENQLSEKKEKLKELTDGAGSRGAVPLIIFGGLLVLSGVLALILSFAPMGIGLAAAGCFAALIGISLKRKAKDAEEERRSKQEEIDVLKAEIERDRLYAGTLKAEIAEYVRSMELPADDKSVIDSLYKIKGAYERYVSLLAKKQDQRDDRLAEEISGIRKEIENFFMPYRGYFQEDGIDGLAEALHSYKDALAEYIKAQGAVCDFERDNDMARIRAVGTSGEFRALDEITADMTELDSRMDEIRNTIHHQSEMLEDCLRRRDELNEAAAELAEQREKLEELNRKKYLLEKTGQFMTEAHTRLTNRYRKPVSEGFLRYYELLNGSAANNCVIDADMGLSVSESGALKKLDLYSSGTQDKINLCMRMALIDAMYKEDRPFVIMDDPFTNLDDERLKGGLEMVRTLAEDRQIIYMTCHDSRAV